MNEQEQQVIEKVNQLLHIKPSTTQDHALEILEEIKNSIRYLDIKYYKEAVSLISDYEYDQLFALLKQWEELFPQYISTDSPTQRLTATLNEDFESVRHTLPMLSLENSYSVEDLYDFERRVKSHDTHKKVSYSAEPKFDGSSIALFYENDKLIRAATRGDGYEGENITSNAKAIRNIPLSAAFSKFNIYKAEIRGEVIIAKSDFILINQERENQGLSVFQNARNTASGSLRLKDPNEVTQRKLSAFMYHLAFAEDQQGNSILGNQLLTHASCMQLLSELGFRTPSLSESLGNIEKVIECCDKWSREREFYPFEIDGMVVKVDDLQFQAEIGSTAHHPRWAIAFKFKAKQAQTELLQVEFQVGRTGAITPVAKLKPVALGGVTISSVSLHNEEFIKEKNINIGSTVLVERAGEVIPYIAGVVEQNSESVPIIPIVFPKHCPSCHSSLIKQYAEAIWRCENEACPAQIEEKLIHFVSKDAMDIQGLGRDIIIRFIQENIVNHIPDIYKINPTYEEGQRVHQIAALPGWKQKSLQNLIQGIEASKNNPLWRLINGLGIRHVGTTTAKYLAKQIKHLSDLSHWSLEELMTLQDIGPKVAESIYLFFKNQKNVQLLDELEKLGVTLHQTDNPKESSQILQNKTFLFTGTLVRLSRDKAKELVESNGGKLLSSVSKNLNYLVTGADAGSKLDKAQKLNTIQIISEDDFFKMIEEPQK